MLSVLHVTTRMMPSGTELQLAGTLLTAKDRHWDPTLCVLYPGFPLAQRLADAGVRVIELDGSSRLHVDRMRALRERTRSGAYDVVQTSLWGAGAFGRIGVLGPGRPAVVMSERRVEDFRPRRLRALDRALSTITDEWIGNSRDVCDFIERAHGAPASRVHLIRNGIDAATFHPTDPGGSQSGRGIPSDRPLRIGGLGRLVEQKGFDVLIDALPAVLARHEVELVIAGEGELRGDLERRAAGLPVTLPGALDGAAAVADYLRGLDLFVMPSRYEGLPNAVLEALACGVRVVATDVPGMAEATGAAATLVPADDSAALAGGILETLDRQATGAAPPVASFDEVAAAHLRVFELAVERRRARSSARAS